MSLQSIDPASGLEIKTYNELTDAELEAKLSLAQRAYQNWRELSYEERAVYFKKAAEILRKNKNEYGLVMTAEMGKPLNAAEAESEKCGLVCEYYAKETEGFLAHEKIATDAKESYVRFDPLGVILAVMPWNFPFWQLFRAAAPAIMAGNVMLLKHASNVPACGFKIEENFREAGFPEGVFQNLAIGSGRVEGVLRDPRVVGATLTGSEYAGSQVAKVCGEEIKPTILELGGSDPFIVLADADVSFACETAVTARLQNAGQSCIAAKRFIVVEEVYEDFIEKLKANFAGQIMGDPTDRVTTIGPLATEKILWDLEVQVKKSVDMGARLVIGGRRHGKKGFFYEPTILANVVKGMPAYDEETFGPVAAIIKVKDAHEAIMVANDTQFGLGASLWTRDVNQAKKLAARIEAGAVFINGMVKSDPRLPFGGIKKSGYGRELSHYALKAFTNVKTVWIK